MTQYTLRKSEVDDDGQISRDGIHTLELYARGWVSGQRILDLEEKYPELAGSFYDIRADSEYAQDMAGDDGLEKALDAAFNPPEFIATV